MDNTRTITTTTRMTASGDVKTEVTTGPRPAKKPKDKIGNFLTTFSFIMSTKQESAFHKAAMLQKLRYTCIDSPAQ